MLEDFKQKVKEAVIPKEMEKKLESELQHLTEEQRKLALKVFRVQGATKRMEVFSNIMDGKGFLGSFKGVDALIGLIEGPGDIISGVFSTLYILHLAKQAGLSEKSMNKIRTLHVFDTLVGAIPFVGSAWDFFFKANKRSHTTFLKRVKTIEAEAKRKGIPEEDVQKLREAAEKLPNVIDGLMKGAKAAKKLKKITDKKVKDTL